MKFKADSIEYWSKDGVETVFFGNEQKELALLISGNSDGHYLEWNDQSNAFSNAADTVKLSGQQLHIRLLPEAAKKLGPTEFIITFEADEALEKEVIQCLADIFGKKFVLEKSDAPKKAPPQKDYSKIRYLSLEGKKLKQLPEYVREMKALETVKLGSNPHLDLQNMFEVLATLPNVKELNFSVEKQPIPDSIGQLANLESLYITGFPVPQALPEGFGKLKKLKSLTILGDADLTLPESFADLESLELMNLRVPSWTLPSRFYQLTKLTTLDFSNCRFTRFPEEIAGMTAVTTLILGGPDNHDYGQILKIASKMPHLKELELSNHPIPPEIALCRQVEELNFWTGYGRDVTLQLPEALFELDQLKRLFLSHNRFDNIPESLGRLKNLEKLIFVESNFETLPESIGNLPNLTFLNITENPSLTALPESIGKLAQLRELCLRDNPKLTRLPDSMQQLSNLQTVGISPAENILNIPEAWKSLMS